MPLPTSTSTRFGSNRSSVQFTRDTMQAIDLPSGAICGSEMVTIFCKSESSIRFAWVAAVPAVPTQKPRVSSRDDFMAVSPDGEVPGRATRAAGVKSRGWAVARLDVDAACRCPGPGVYALGG